MEICDGIIYSAVTKSWAVGVSAERVSSQSSIDDVQSAGSDRAAAAAVRERSPADPSSVWGGGKETNCYCR